MQVKQKTLSLLGALFVTGVAAVQPPAMTPEELFTMAMTQNSFTGEKLVRGGFADEYKNVTRSSGNTYASIERMGQTKDGCDILNLKVRQTEIPAKNGKIIGDYITVTRLAICSNGAEPQFDKSSEVIDCVIANTSCMPRK